MLIVVRTGRRGQKHGEAGAGAGTALDPYRPAVGTNDAEHGREAEPTSRDLGGEERVEDPMQRRLVHAAAVVVHLHEDVPAGSGRLADHVVAERGVVGIAYAGAGRDPARAAHDRFAGVRQQIHQDLSDLRVIAFDRRERRGEVDLDHVAGERRPQQAQHLLGQRRQVDRGAHDVATA